MKIELVSKQFHKFGGKLRRKGEKIMATPAEAKVLRALGRAMDVQPAAAPAADKPKRAYKRRDMVAETAEAAAPASTVVAAAAVTPPPVVIPAEEVAPEPAPVRNSLVNAVEKVREEFRAKFPPTPAPAERETLHVTRPKKSTA
jgi:hypothetical protein